MRLLNNSIAQGFSFPLFPPLYGAGMLRFIMEGLEQQVKQAVLWGPVFLALGIGVYFLLPFEPSLYSSVLAFVVFAGVCALTLKRGAYLGTLALVFFLLLPLAGFIMAQLGTQFYGTPMLSRDLGPVTVQGTVAEIELLDQQSDVRLLLSDLRVEDLETAKTPRKVRLRFRDAPEGLKSGQRVTVLAQLMGPSAPLIPGGFDFRRHFFFQGIGAVGFVYRMDGEIQDVEPSRAEAGHGLENLRSAIAANVHALLPEMQANIVEALMIGRRAGIPDHVYDDLRKSGLAHLLAISGLHIGLVAGALFFFVRLGLATSERLSLHKPIKKYAALVAISGAFIYMILAGAPIPTQRAMIMTAIMLGAILIERWPFSLRAVAVAAFVILLIAPHSLLSVSFQLSFAAVTALVAASELLLRHWQAYKNKPGVLKRVLLYFAGVACTSFLAALATAPFALYHFQQLALLGVLANMVAIPLMAFVVMPAGILAMLLMPLGLEGLPLKLMGVGVSWIVRTAHSVSAMEMSTLEIAQFTFSSFLMMVLAGLSLIIFSGRFRFIASGLFAVLALLTFQFKTYDILVSSDLKLVGMQQERRLVLSSTKRDKFTADIWARALHLPVAENIALFDLPAMQCGSDGCRYEKKGVRVAFPSSDYALGEDCLWADIVIADFYMESGCSGPAVIDKRSLWRTGAVGIKFSSRDLAPIIEVSEKGTLRPWH